MINDGAKPLCIAGTMGGLNSGVTFETKNIFLESAYFDPGTVRKTAKRLGINYVSYVNLILTEHKARQVGSDVNTCKPT